jgi:signal transduction histidine kinase
MGEQPFRRNENQRRKTQIKIDLLIHDLKVPLAVVEAGCISLLERRDRFGPLSETQERVLLRSLRNTRVMRALVNDALELAKAKAGILTIQPVRLSEVIVDALIELFDLVDAHVSERIRKAGDLAVIQATLRDMHLALHVDDDVWNEEVHIDVRKVTQILRNLLDNALKYRQKNAVLEIRKLDDHVSFAVADDGEGIPQNHHDRILASYFQMDVAESTHVRAHGLGLAGVKVLVEDMGGTLALISDAGKGATFSVRLPVVRHGPP